MRYHERAERRERPPEMTRIDRAGRRSHRQAAATAIGLLAAGLLITSCSGAGQAVAPTPHPHVVLTRAPRARTGASTSTTTSTTTTEVPDCGSLRDPFDPTDAAPPAGSPAIC